MIFDVSRGKAHATFHWGLNWIRQVLPAGLYEEFSHEPELGSLIQEILCDRRSSGSDSGYSSVSITATAFAPWTGMYGRQSLYRSRADDDPAQKAEKEGINGWTTREKQGTFGKTYFHWTSDVPLKRISDIELSVSVKFTSISDGYVGNLWVI